MKTTFTKIAGLLAAVMMLACIAPTFAQGGKDYITVKGVVKDKTTKRALEYVSISVPGSNIGTVTNINGEFSLKIKDSLNAKSIKVSHLGYSTHNQNIRKEDMTSVDIFLTPNVNLLDEITVLGFDAEVLVRRAISRIEHNYSPNTALLEGFYRETIRKRRTYINVSEAIVEVYKTPYQQGLNRDLVQIYKGRKLISPNPQDTLMVRLLGGPTLAIYLDVVKNPDLMLSEETLAYYKFAIEESVMIDDRAHYVVAFEPKVSLPFALHFGKLYIDKDNLTFSKAVFSVSMDDRNKATQAILKKKPMGMQFKPEEITFLVNYKQRDNRTYLSYIRSEIRFKCDWKKRLFSTNYSIVSELVITGGKEENASRIPAKLAFRESQALYDKVDSFYDKDFWEDYNIIEPDESLENAVIKLKKANTK
jgi:hypothetical protein